MGGAHSAEARPGADGLAAAILPERRPQDGQAPMASSAAPMPRSTRAAISVPALGAIPLRTGARAHQTTPVCSLNYWRQHSAISSRLATAQPWPLVLGLVWLVWARWAWDLWLYRLLRTAVPGWVMRWIGQCMDAFGRDGTRITEPGS